MLADIKEKQITWEDLEVAEEVNSTIPNILNLKPRIILSWEQHDSIIMVGICTPSRVIITGS